MDKREAGWFWNKIALLSFICSIMVVYIHSDNTGQYSINEATGIGFFTIFLETKVLTLLTKGAVPLFFFVSGYLFYRNYSWSKIKEKYRSRVWSLLTPYLSWNTLYTIIVVFFSIVPFFYNIVSEHWLMNPISISEILRGVFLYQYNPIFWFIFQLILYVAISPILFGILKNRYIGITFLLLLMLYGFWVFSVPIIKIDMFLLYSFGAYLGIHYQEQIENKYSKGRSIITIAAFIVFQIGMYKLCSNTFISSKIIEIMEKVLMISYVLALFFGVDLLKKIYLKEYMKCTFFIYALHLLVLSIYKKIFRTILPDNEWIAILTFVVIPIITVVTICILANIIQRRCISLYRIMAGGRS